MTATTLKALKASIEHWKRLVTGKRRQGEDIGYAYCALCTQFIFKSPYCKGCPVKEKTGLSCCEGTPYNEVEHARMDGLDSPKFTLAAKKELKFLQRLLPKERGKR